MVALTLLVATARLVFVVLTNGAPFYAVKLSVPFQFLSEAETFFAAMVSCLPGVRAWLRLRRSVTVGLHGPSGSPNVESTGDFILVREQTLTRELL